MTFIKRIARAAALATLALAARPAAAQGITSPIRYVEQAQGFGPFAGWVFASPTVTLNDTSTVDIGPRSAPIFGLSYQVRASGPLALQADVGYIASKRKVFLAEAVADSTAIRAIPTGREANVGILLAEAGLLFHLTGPRTYHNLAPFIGLKAGYARQISGSDPQDSTVPPPERYRFGPSFAVATNLGSDVFVTRTMALRLELNGRLWRESVPPGFRATGQTKLGEWNNASSAQLGLVLHF